jgi:hypothetical protein
MKDWIDNISDDDFDEVFRTNADKHHENLWPEAWPLMEEKLEEENKKRRYIIFWRWAAAFLIFGALGVFSLNYIKSSSSEQQTLKVPRSSPKTSKSVVPEAKENPQLLLGKNNANTSISPNLEPQNNDNSSQSTKTKLRSILDSKNLVSGNQRSLPKANKSTLKEISVYREIAKIENPKPLEIQAKNDSQQTKLAQNGETNTSPPTSETLLSKVPLNEKVDKPIAESYFSEDTVVVSNNDNNTILTQNNSNQQTEGKGENESQILRKFAFNIGFSPDYSRVQTSEFGAMGYNIQAILDYKITQKLTFRGGIIRSLKLYDAYPENYAWPAKWGTPSSPLKEIAATCNMLDIPMSLSYNFYEKSNHKIFSSLGITNYKMLKEKYEYSYENNYDPNLKWKKWEGNTGFFGAGIINFSLGFERRLTRQLSLQIEPFVKIPIKKVGFGDVKLLSSGLFFNLKTNFTKKTSQPK